MSKEIAQPISVNTFSRRKSCGMLNFCDMKTALECFRLIQFFFLNFYTIVRNFCTWNLRGLKQRTRSGTTNIDAFFYLFLLDFHWFIDICVWHWWEFLELLTLIKYLWIAVPSNLKTNFPKICKLTSAMK